jgi:hypothetical protein
MVHFETIWNEAESVAKSYTKLSRKDIFTQIRDSLDNLSDSESQEEYHESLGDILFGLCSLCACLEDRKNIIVDSASALAQAIERKRSELISSKAV